MYLRCRVLEEFNLEYGVQPVTEDAAAISAKDKVVPAQARDNSDPAA